MAPQLLKSVLSASLLAAAEASLWAAKQCAGEVCTNPDYPMLDWDNKGNKCICRKHPCWEDNGKVHTCSATGEFPFLSYTYLEDGSLKCKCSKFPHPGGSVTVAKDLCKGGTCDPEKQHSVLDYNETSKECMCVANPCKNDKGMEHRCDTDAHAEFPVLTYSYGKDKELKCGCRKKWIPQEILDKEL
jgi:hypothetical protein